MCRFIVGSGWAAASDGVVAAYIAYDSSRFCGGVVQCLIPVRKYEFLAINPTLRRGKKSVSGRCRRCDCHTAVGTFRGGACVRVCGVCRDSAGRKGRGKKEAVRWISDLTADKRNGPLKMCTALIIEGIDWKIGLLPFFMPESAICRACRFRWVKDGNYFRKKKYYVTNRTFLLANITFYSSERTILRYNYRVWCRCDRFVT